MACHCPVHLPDRAPSGEASVIKSGSIPTKIFGPILSRLLRSAGVTPTEFSRTSGVDETLIRRVISQEREGITFDTADKILCTLGAPHVWWDEIPDTYYSADLFEKKQGYCHRGLHEMIGGNVRIGKRGNSCRECYNTRKRERYRCNLKPS